MTECIPLTSAQQHQAILAGYRNLLPIKPNCEPNLAALIGDTLANPGSMTRAQLAYKVLLVFHFDEQRALAIAIAIEYFHTASLLLDDLSCMDDAFTRRGKVCVHRKYGEAAAVLGALSFINRAYALIWRELSALPPSLSGPASEVLADCLGLAGVINGQSLDLHFDPDGASPESVSAVAEGKTVTMIRLAVVLPAIIAGASHEQRLWLESLVYHWGLAYQLLDDFKDVLHDESAGKSTGRDQRLKRPNMVLAIGCDATYQRLQQHFQIARESMERLRQTALGWDFLDGFMARLQQTRLRLQLDLKVA